MCGTIQGKAISGELLHKQSTYGKETFIEMLAVEDFVGLERACVCAGVGIGVATGADFRPRSTLPLLECPHHRRPFHSDQNGLSNLRNLHCLTKARIAIEGGTPATCAVHGLQSDDGCASIENSARE